MSFLDDILQQQEATAPAPASFIDTLIQPEAPATPEQKQAIIPLSHPLAPTELQDQANKHPINLMEALAPIVPGMEVPSLLDTLSKTIGGVPTEPVTAPDFTSPAELKAREPVGVGGHIVYNLERLGAATRKFIQTLPEEGLSLHSLADAFKGAASELANPTERRTTMDMLRRYAPNFVARNPQQAQQIGFIGDMSTDPMMALSAGTDGPAIALSDGTKAALNPEGEAMLAKKIADVGKLAAENPNFKTMIEAAVPKAEQALKSAALKADQAIMIQAKNWMADIIEAGNKSILDKGGIKFAGKTIPKTPELLDIVGKATHIDDIKNWLSTMSGRVNAAKLMRDAEAAKKPLTKEEAQKLADQTSGVINRFQIHADNLKDEVNHLAANFFLDRDLGDVATGDNQRNLIGRARYEIRDATTKELEVQAASNPQAAQEYDTYFPKDIGVAQGKKAMGTEFPSALSEVPDPVTRSNIPPAGAQIKNNEYYLQRSLDKQGAGWVGSKSSAMDFNRPGGLFFSIRDPGVENTYSYASTGGQDYIAKFIPNKPLHVSALSGNLGADAFWKLAPDEIKNAVKNGENEKMVGKWVKDNFPNLPKAAQNYEALDQLVGPELAKRAGYDAIVNTHVRPGTLTEVLPLREPNGAGEYLKQAASPPPTSIPQANRMADMAASEMPSDILGTQPGTAPVPPPMPETASEIAARIKTQIIDKYRKLGLSDAGVNAIQGLSEIDAKIYQAHQATGIMYDQVLNHAFRAYEKDPEEVTQLHAMIQAGFPKEWLPEAMQTQYKYLSDALAAGKNPIYDAAQTLAAHLYDAQLTSNSRVLSDTLKELYNVKSFDELPLTVQKDLRFVGNSRFSWFGADRSSQFIKTLKGLQRVQNGWKKYATSASEFFGPRQLPQNIFQTFLAEGPKALKSIDLTNLRDAIIIKAHGTPGNEMLGHGLKMTDTYGKALPDGAALSDLFKETGIIRGTNKYTEARQSETVSELLHKQTANNFIEKNIKEFFVNRDGPEAGMQAFKRTMTGGGTVSHFLHWPSIVEDVNRIAIALGHLKQGKSISELAPLVNKSLFDYSHTMGEFQQQVVKQVIPFFTYTKFMGELAAKTLVTHPGRILGMQKFGVNLGITLGKLYQQIDAMEKGQPVNPKDMLSPQDQNSLPGRLFDDVAGYAGLDPDFRKRFLTFHNYSPGDILDTFNVYDENGKVDLRNAARNVMGRMISPIIRIPISDAQGLLLPKTKDIFSDQVLFDPNKPGKKIGPENLRPEDVLNNIVANVTATQSGRVELGMITRALGMANISPADIPAVTGVFKWLMGWKVAKDPYTGKNMTYVNPWMAFHLGSLYPQFGRALSLADPSKTPAEKAMELGLGIKTQRVDIAQQRGFKLSALQHEYNDILDDIRHSRGQDDRVEKLQKQAQDVMQQIQQYYGTNFPPTQ